MEVCYRCGGTGISCEVICGWCEQGANHSHCDDTYHRRIPCQECSKGKTLPVVMADLETRFANLGQ